MNRAVKYSYVFMYICVRLRSCNYCHILTQSADVCADSDEYIRMIDYRHLYRYHHLFRTKHQ